MAGRLCMQRLKFASCHHFNVWQNPLAKFPVKGKTSDMHVVQWEFHQFHKGAGTRAWVERMIDLLDLLAAFHKSCVQQHRVLTGKPNINDASAWVSLVVNQSPVIKGSRRMRGRLILDLLAALKKLRAAPETVDHGKKSEKSRLSHVSDHGSNWDSCIN